MFIKRNYNKNIRYLIGEKYRVKGRGKPQYFQ